MARLTELPTDDVLRYARTVFNLPDVRANVIVKAAKIQLNINRVGDYAHSLSHMILTATHDAQVNGLKSAIRELMKKRK